MFSLMKTIRSLAALVCLGALCVAAASAQTVQLGFAPSTDSFTCGETLYVDIMLDDSGAGDLAGFSLVFEFDDEILAPLEVLAGDLLSGADCPHFFTWLNAESVGNSIVVDGALLGCTRPVDGHIVRMVFEGVVIGLSSITCQSGVMRDGQNGQIPFSSGEGHYEFTCPTPAPPIRWGEVKSIYR